MVALAALYGVMALYKFIAMFDAGRSCFAPSFAIPDKTSQVGWAQPTTPSIHQPPAPPPQTQGHFSFNDSFNPAQAFYVVGFCKDGSAI
jgi:hypothetical protein